MIPRRGFIGALAAAAASVRAAFGGGHGESRPMAQWQWRLGEVGKEVEETVKRVLSQCDIGAACGTVVFPPSQHQVILVWIDMDYNKVEMAWQRNRKVCRRLQMRSYAIAVIVRCLMMYPEDELVEAMQKAIAAGEKRPQVRTWGGRLEPDSDDCVVHLTDHLVDWSLSKGVKSAQAPWTGDV